jgi:CRP/FNR family transcriptional regulator, cyclic AMP receptor protein
MNTLIDKIGAHTFFRGLSREHLQIVATGASEARFGANDILFRAGEPANTFYLIQSGRISLEGSKRPDRDAQLQTVEAGNVVGWSWLFPPFAWHFQGRALEPTSVIALKGGYLLATAERDHEFGYELMKRVAQIVIQRLQTTRQRLVESNSKVMH